MKKAMKQAGCNWGAALVRMGCIASVLVLAGCGEGKGTLYISSTPAEARILVNGVAQGETPMVLPNLAPGQYVVELQKEGYNPVYKAVALLDKQELKLDLSMEQTTGLLLVDSKPRHVEVVLDGLSKGSTPLLLTDLPLGSYKLEFKSPTVIPRTMETELADRKPVRVLAELVSNTAKLVIGSEPLGAEVLINGVACGNTPITLDDVVAGPVDVKVIKPGYTSYARNMELVATRSYEIKAELTALPSTVVVNTDPPGATVAIDGQASGSTPLTVNARDGEREVVIALMGYETVTTNIVLDPNATERLDLNLVKNSGTLVLDTEPASVKIYVDGALFGVTEPKGGADTISKPVSLLLKAGVGHTIQLVREGYVAASITLQPELEQIITRHEVLKRIFVRDTMITTKTEVIKCRLEYKLPNGNIYYERFPGVFDTAKAADILEVQPIGLEDESNREARRLLELNKQVVPSP